MMTISVHLLIDAVGVQHRAAHTEDRGLVGVLLPAAGHGHVEVGISAVKLRVRTGGSDAPRRGFL